MNVGLSNLTSLKAQLLAPSLRADTDYDATISAIGLGVANQIDRYCNRKFAYQASEQDQFRADRRHWYLRRYPVVSIISCQRQDTLTDGWTNLAVSDLIQQWNLNSGYVSFIALQGYEFSQLLITYQGGFFFETLEPGDPGYPSPVPTGATALPNDVLLAWFLQCQNIWRQWDKLGNQIADNPEGQTSAQNIKLAAAVKEMLDPHRRLSAT
jgi:hypothetical protein